MASVFGLLGGLLAISFSFALAVNNLPIYDFCVADLKSPVLVDGVVCKDPKLVNDKDFFLSGLHIPGNTSNPNGSKVTPASVTQIPGLNTLGLALGRADIAPYGINPPHTHRASEIMVVLEGTIEAGFITSNPENRLISRVLSKGDVFVFPVGTIHYQRNLGPTPAVAMAALNSESPGFTYISTAMFGSKPDLPTEMLARAFQTDKNIISGMQWKF